LSGAGYKFKVPQAMSYGLPVVATPIAAEGLIAESGLEIFAVVTADPDEMASAIVALLTDIERATRIGRAGRRWVEDHLNPRSLEEVILVYRSLVLTGQGD
jgi:glycosyltransferase involved in cell wall biosynthesis